MKTPNSATNLGKGETWDKVYTEARATLRDATSVLATADEAVTWANELISRIDRV